MRKLSHSSSTLLSLIFTIYLTQSHHHVSAELATQQCSTTSNRAVIQQQAGGGDQALIGGILAVREPAAGDMEGCGELRQNIEEVEAIRWALERINQDSGTINGDIITESYIPGVKIGITIIDTCGSDEAGTHSAQQFLPSLYQQSSACNSSQDSIFLGFIGELYSSLSMHLANLAGKFGVPQISFSATAPSLSNNNMYPTFMRTISADIQQAKVIVKVIQSLNWERFVVVHSTGAYGTEGLEALIMASNEAGLCIATAVSVRDDESSQNALQAAIRDVINTGVTGVVYFGQLELAKRLLRNAESIPDAGKLQWIFSEGIGTSPLALENILYFKGGLVVTVANRNVPEFEDHWVRIDENNPSAENPWFKEWYMTVNECRLSGVVAAPFASYPPCQLKSETEKRQSYIQNQYTEPAIMAVYTYAKALKNAHQQLCGTPGLCSQLRRLSHEDFFNNYLLPLDMTFTREERVSTLSSNLIEPWKAAKRIAFDDNGDIENVAYEVWNYKNTGTGFEFAKVGSYVADRLEFNAVQITFYNEARDTALPTMPTSDCPIDGCNMCFTATAQDNMVMFAHKSGDILIGGLFPVHDQGDNGFNCGAFNSWNSQLVEAFLYAINKVSSTSMITGATLGGVAFDNCANPALSQRRIANFNGHVTSAMDLTGQQISPESVQIYLGGDTSKTAMQESAVLNEYGLPLVGYGGNAAALTDEEEYPLFASTMFNAKMDVKIAILILKKLGISYVQQVYADNMASQSMAMMFRKQAAMEGICIAASSKISPDVPEELKQNPDAHIVLVWVDEDESIVEYVNALAASDARTHFTMLGPVGWPGVPGIDRTKQEVKEAIDGTISWMLKQPDTTNFNVYLNQIDVDDHMSNPWYSYWYQEAFNCYLDAKNPGAYTQQCAKSTIPLSGDFMINWDTALVINGVFAIAKGLETTLKQFCGNTYDHVCSDYFNAENRSEVLIQNIRDTSFMDESNNMIKFIEGSGTWPINIFSLKDGDYKQGGSYSHDNGLTLSIPDLFTRTDKPLEATCASPCAGCNYVALHQDHFYQEGDYIIGALFDIHRSGPSPFSCGDVRMDRSYQYSEAFLYALEQVNSGNGPVGLNGVTLGGLGMDVCSSGLRAASIVSGIHSGSIIVDDLDEETIVTWMSRNTGESLEVADVTKGLNIPQIGMTATSPLLQDKNRAPMFFYTTTAEDILARGMAGVAQQMGWQYVQTLNAASPWGRSSIEAFSKAAADLNMCVLNSIEFGSMSYQDLVTSLVMSPTDVVVIFAEMGDIRQLLEAKKAIGPSADKLTFITSEMYGDISDLSDGIEMAAKGLITFKMNSPVIQEFNNYLADKFPGSYDNNPWFDDYYQALYECNLPGNFRYDTDCVNTETLSLVDASDYNQEFLLVNTINAVYMVTAALNNTLVTYCGQNYNGICEQFKSAPQKEVYTMLMEEMEKVRFTDPSGAEFYLEDRQYDQGYKIFSFKADGSYEQIGTYKREGLFMTGTGPRDFYNTLTVDCGTKCSQCQLAEQRQEKFTYVPGDIILGGVFDVHTSGGSPFTCGSLSPRHGIQLLEAFNYAIEYVNNKEGMFADKLQGVTIGGVGLDACGSSTRAGNLIANIHSGLLPLTANSQKVDTDRIEAYIGAFNSESSMQMADVLNVLNIPQISYGATSIALKDRVTYPYFLRTVPADDKQARAMVAILQKFKFTYVQVVNSPGIYGEQAAKEFVKQATLKGICVAQSTTISDDIDVSRAEADSTVRTMLGKPNAKVVITFLNTGHIRPFLQAIKDNNEAKDLFHYIASESWANYKDIVQGFEDIVKNSITLGVETSDLTDFDEYLEPKNPNNYFANPWFLEYYESVFDCSLTGGSSSYPQACSDSVRSIVRAQRYVQDPYIIYAVDAVFAAAEGINTALERLCGDGYVGVCDSFRTSGDKRQYIFEGIKDVKFEDESEQIFEFNDEGESYRGYHLYTVKVSTGTRGLYYQNIGSYNTTHLLKIATSFDVDWESNCEASGSCSECSQIHRETSRIMEIPSSEGLNIAAFIDIHGADAQDPFKCGQLSQMNFLDTLAFFYAIEQINKENVLNLPADIKIGGVAIDTCGSSMSASRDLYALMSGQGLCYGDSQITAGDIVAINVHTSSSDALRFHEVLSPLKMLTMSASATSPELSDKEYFLRTLPADDLQAKVMVELARQMEWKYVAVIASEGAYGQNGAEMFLSLAKDMNGNEVCVGSQPVLPKDATLDDAKDLVRELHRTMGDCVVYLFTTDRDAKLILQATQDLGLDGKLTFVGSEYWGSSMDVVEGVEDAAQGSITIKINTPPAVGFMKWTESLNVADHGSIPDDWFEEFWQDALECRLENATVVSNAYSRVCTRTDTLVGRLDQSSYVLPMVISVEIVAQGLANIEACRRSPSGFSACLAQLGNRQEEIYMGIKDSTWQSPRGEVPPGETLNFQFTDEGNGNLGYVILNYQRGEKSLEYEQIGTYQSELTFDKTKYRNSNYKDNFVTSLCPNGNSCNCLAGTGFNGSNTGGRGVNGNGGNGNGGTGTGGTDGGPRTGASTSPEDNFGDIWKIIVAVLAGLGILVTLLMGVYLIIFYPVKGGTSAVGYLLLFTVLLMYTLTFAFIVVPSFDVCTIRRFCLGIIFALAFACMLVKVLNTWRIGDGFGEFNLPEYKRLSHPCSLFFIALGITMVQVIINIEWLVLKPPGSEWIEILDSGTNKEVWWSICTEVSFHYQELVISCIYVMFLIFLTFIFSLVTWDSEENHRESRWICITACFSIAIWIVWTVVATLTEQRYRDPAIAIACVANATVILLCIFVRKLWLLRRYEKEIEEEKTRMSTLSRGDKTLSENGIHTNPMYLYVDSASVSGNSNIVYHAPRSPGAPDVVY